jgi:hypothetical protein
MKSMLFAVFLFTLLSCPAFASAFIVMGAGVQSCGTWTVDRMSADLGPAAQVNEAWILGYVTGDIALLAAVENKSVSITTDANGLFGWIDQWCQNNPAQNMTNAIQAFLGTQGSVNASPP